MATKHVDETEWNGKRYTKYRGDNNTRLVIQYKPLDLSCVTRRVDTSFTPEQKTNTETYCQKRKHHEQHFSVSGGWVIVEHTAIPYVWRDNQQYLSVPVLKYGAGFDSLLSDNMTVLSTSRESEHINQLCKHTGIHFTFKQETKLVALKTVAENYPYFTSMIRAVSNDVNAFSLETQYRRCDAAADTNCVCSGSPPFCGHRTIPNKNTSCRPFSSERTTKARRLEACIGKLRIK